MTDAQKIQLATTIENILQNYVTSDDMPILVGKLNTPYGLNGFTRAETGHPVFEFKERYVIYLDSEKELTERVFNPKSSQHETKVGYFKVAVPFYKETLRTSIEFI
jgi:hypothetical protein